MSTILVGMAGPATSIQDFGRYGWQRYGLGPAGALDRFALAAANALVRRPANAAAVEIGPFATHFHVVDGAVHFALFGADRLIKVGPEKVAMSMTGYAAAGETIALGPARGGVFTYLAFAGGITGCDVLGSMSVHARAGLGSPYARPLKAGDLLEIERCRSWQSEQSLSSTTETEQAIRVVLGPQDDYYSPSSMALFLATEWRVSATSDRMAYRLLGPTLEHSKGSNIVSDGTVNGSIQVPGNGLPLVLLPDRGTVGGYPKLAVIISADLGRFAQTPAGGRVHFRAITVEDAQQAATKYRRSIERLPERTRATNRQLQSELMMLNVADAAVNAIDIDE